MRPEWIFLGAVLLSLGLALKVLLDREMFPRLVVGFSILWALAVAIHFWGPAYRTLGPGLTRLLSSSPRFVEVLCFWVTFVPPAAVGLLLAKFAVGDADVSFPLPVDRVLRCIVPLAVSIGLPSAVIMSGALLGVSLGGIIPSAPDTVMRVSRRLQSLPVESYMWLAGRGATAEVREQILADRIPERAAEVLLSGGP